MTTRTGGCLCGAVRYRVTGEGGNATFCHCRSCRLAVGSAGVAWVVFDPSNWQITRGRPSELASSEHVVRSFCGRCGCALTYWNARRPHDLDVTLSTLDDPSGLEPQRHIWVSEKPEWLILEDGLPQFARWADEAAASVDPPRPEDG